MKFLLLILFLSKSFHFSSLAFQCNKVNIYMSPSEYGCTLFHFCTPGVEFYNWSCRNGYHFSPEHRECMHPHLANCVLPCPDDPTKTYFQLHYGDCSKYYVCQNGEAVLYQCPNGTLFNTNPISCDDPSVVDCGIRGDGTATMPITTTTQAVPTTFNPNPTCPEEQGPFFHANPYDSRNFTACFDHMLISTQCTEGYLFNPIHNDCCVNGECPITTTASTSTTTTAIPSTPSPTTSAIPSTPSPTTTELITTTHEPTTISSTETTVIIITTPEDVTTTTASTTPKPCAKLACPLKPGTFFFPHPTKCRNYYRCQLGIASLLTCPVNQEFDYMDEECKENGRCCST